jgi:hypothetical protein
LHWNEPDLVGNKYGLVFYSHKAIIKARALDSLSHMISPAEDSTP